MKYVYLIAFAFILLTFNVSALSATINITNNEVGQIREDFYGFNSDALYFGNLTIIRNSTGDIILNSSYDWHRQKLLDSGVKNVRVDMNLQVLSTSQYALDTSATSNSRDINKHKSEVKWAYDNNITLTYIAGYMPLWLANTTFGYCMNDNTTCPPTNYTEWGNLVVRFIDNATWQGLYNSTINIQIWNEAFSQTYWMKNVSYTNITRTLEYIKLYNATYNAIKTKYPNMKVFGGVDQLDGGGQTVYQGLLSNLSISKNILSFNTYGDETKGNYGNFIKSILNQIDGNCSYYGASCNDVYITEFKYKNATLMNQSRTNINYFNRHGQEISSVYSDTLNHNASRYSMWFYNWAYTANYTSGFMFSSVAEPNLENFLYAPYIITKLFATNHKAGNTVLSSSSNDSTIKVVASKDNSGKMYITITNTNTSAINLTLTGLSSNLRNVETNVTYSVNSSGSLRISNFASYGVTFLESDYPRFIVNYTATYSSNALSGYHEGSLSILNYIISMIINFFSLFPVYGILLSVVIIMGAIYLLIKVISKLKPNNNFTG